MSNTLDYKRDDQGIVTLTIDIADRPMNVLTPEFMAELGMNAARLDPEDLLGAARRAAAERFGSEELVLSFFRPYLYLNSAAITKAGLDQKTVEAAIEDDLVRHDGIAPR